ncbi:type II toxin-antitoxin system PemK/MazF family toxin [Propionicicella superfundia]|uniref:type II toxin-antitoxin system PemK/MazF family toxin n=1 Tax=Propionicicella superfundia TaxID=348582 RepID=UPI00041C4218|nr:type II toxin-antitoxin system PemK/MazF family toxin [Propionicicella superfundia]
MSDSRGLLGLLGRAVGYLLNAATASQEHPARSESRTSTPRGAPPAAGDAYPGDYEGMPPVSYAPRDDGEADPGEVVWTWVPFEEDHAQGKDRPVLVVGRDDPWLLALPVTSKDHDRDARQEASAGRFWCDIGTGDWDRGGRPSEARVNRVIRVDPAAVRRTGGRLPEKRFAAVVAQMRAHLS